MKIGAIFTDSLGTRWELAGNSLGTRWEFARGARGEILIKNNFVMVYFTFILLSPYMEI
jgi:hypothetical protein